ncbi:MAG: nickel-binding protein [Rudaea sp.]
MPCFILTHRVVPAFSQEEMLECVKKLVAILPRDVKWLQSFYLPGENHLICHYDSPDLQSIRAAITAAELDHLFPVLRAQEAVEIDPGGFAPPRRPVRRAVKVTRRAPNGRRVKR